MRRLAVLVILACLGRLAAQDVEAQLKVISGLLKQLPPPPAVKAAPAKLPEGRKEFAPSSGIYIIPDKAVVLNAIVLFTTGPADGLEVVACLEGGKNHESLVQLECRSGILLNAAFKAALNLADGAPVPQGSGLPARGTPVSMRLIWVDDPMVDQDAKVGVPISAMMRDRLCDRAWPELPVIYTGSQIREIEHAVPGGKREKRQTFMLDITKSLVTNWDEPDALFNSPFPTAAQDDIHEANGALMPPVDTRTWVVFEPVTLPLVLDMDADGELSRDGKALDDAAVRNVLAETYGPEEPMRAVGIRVTRDIPREVDVRAREHLLKLAVDAETWVVPIFMLAEEQAE